MSIAPTTGSKTGGMTRTDEERRRDAHHILLDLDNIETRICHEAASLQFIKQHGPALREMLRQKAGL